MMKGGVYKKRKVDRERGWTRVSREKKETRRTLRKKRVNSNNSYVTVASSDKLDKINWFTYLIQSTSSSLFLSLG